MTDKINIADQFKLVEEIKPVIRYNFDEVKANLTAYVQKYKNVVVSEQNLQDCKAIATELNKLKNTVNRMRIDKKKEMSAPISEFEEKCKELVKVIDDARNPIAQGVNVYAEEQRNAKIKRAEEIVREEWEKSGLTEGLERIAVKAEYGNATQTENKTRKDIKAQIAFFLEEKAKEEEKRQIIAQLVEAENKRLESKMVVEDFDKYLNETNIAVIVHEKAEAIYAAEQKAKAAVLAETEPIEPEATPAAEPEPIKADDGFPEMETEIFETCNFEVTAKTQDIDKLVSFLSEMGVEFNILARF